jgi:hypothetical protein
VLSFVLQQLAWAKFEQLSQIVDGRNRKRRARGLRHSFERLARVGCPAGLLLDRATGVSKASCHDPSPGLKTGPDFNLVVLVAPWASGLTETASKFSGRALFGAANLRFRTSDAIGGSSSSMSALGQKQTFAAQKGMSALPPIATSIAFFGMSA